jgi:tetratricopeptide (TPR) repeat protein
LVVDELRDLLKNEEISDRDLDEAIRNADRTFESAQQRYPADNYILSTESDLAKLLNDNERSIKALERARIANPRDPFIASRLAAILARRGNTDKARAYLEEALESNRGNTRLNFQYAELLRTMGSAEGDDLIYYYRRAFTKWDANHESQFWFARFAFESKDQDTRREARETFRHLRNVPMSHDERIAIRDAIGGVSSPKRFGGITTRIEAAHGFAALDGRGDWVFFHKNDMEERTWELLKADTRVTFSVGFSLRGPKAVELRAERNAV